jgi:hypothetical protein
MLDTNNIGSGHGPGKRAYRRSWYWPELFPISRRNQDLAKTIVKSAPRTPSMNIPNFHDGHFDGLRIGPSNLVNLFLRTRDGKSFILVLQEVDALTLSEIKRGNIILDLVFRSSGELTRSDTAELYSVDVDAPQATDLLRAEREQGFQLLEINASYGAQGLVLFQTSSAYAVIRPRAVCDIFGGSHPRRPLEAFL